MTIFILTSICFSPVRAQLSPLDSADWYCNSSVNSAPDSIIFYLTRAATLYAQQHDYVREADCYQKIAHIVYIYLNDYERGKALLYKSIATNNKATHI